MKTEEVKRETVERRLQLSLLDPTQGLHLEGLSMGAPLPVMFVLATMTITFQDVLVTTVTWKLVAHPAGGKDKYCEQLYVNNLAH